MLCRNDPDGAHTGTAPARFPARILPQDNLERLDGIQFCAAAAIGAEPGDFKHWADRFSVPLVIIDREAKLNSPEVYLVRSDEAQGMELAIDHLYSRGCRKTGCIIHGKPGTGNADIRHEAICRILKKKDSLQMTHSFISAATRNIWRSSENFCATESTHCSAPAEAAASLRHTLFHFSAGRFPKTSP